MANRAYQLQVNNLVERLTCLQLRVIFNGAANPTLLQGNGFGQYPPLGNLVGLSRSAVGVYTIQLSDAYNNLQAFECDLSPAMNVAVNDGSFVVGSPYVINAVGPTTSIITATAPTGLISLTLNGSLLSFTAPAGFTALQVLTCMQLLVSNNTAGLAAFNLANGSQIAMPAVAGFVSTLFYAQVTSASTMVVGTVSSNPPTNYTVTSSAGGGTFSSSQTKIPQPAWHAIGVPAGLQPVSGLPFIATSVGTAGSGATAFGPIAAPAAWRVEIIDPTTPGPASLTLPQLSPSLSQPGGGQLIMLVRGAASALVDPDAGSIGRIQLWLRNSTVKGKNE